MTHHYRRSVVVAMVALVLGVALTCSAAEKYNWQKFSSAKGRFEILFPGKPTTYHKATHTKIGDIGEEFFTYKDDKMTLTVEYSDLPSLAAIFGGRHTIYNRSKNGFLKSTNGKEISFVNISVGGTRGKELVYVTPTRNGKTFFLEVGKRLYVIQASMIKKVTDTSPLDKFLHSFNPIYREARDYKSGQK
jgi:hypothetical protein